MPNEQGKEASDRLAARARQVVPGGVHSNVRFELPRLYFEHGRGSRLRDVDGHEYIDYLLGQGPLLLGHADPEVHGFVVAATKNGTVYGAQHELEVEAAELIVETLAWPDKVRLAMTGTEAMQAALRLARAATGRRRVIRFEGHYHGWVDSVLLAAVPSGEWGLGSEGQSSSAASDMVVIPWNDLDAVIDAFARYEDEIACVITEPFMFNNGAVRPRDGFLEGLRRVTKSAGALLIFDEVISGFRVALGGAVELTGVVPDLAVYGKALGAGWPVAAVAGTDEVMEAAGSHRVLLAGTFNSNVASCAAVVATLRRLRDRPPYEDLTKRGAALLAGFKTLGIDKDFPLHAQGLPAVFHASIGPSAEIVDPARLAGLDRVAYQRFASAMIARGVWLSGRGTWFLSAAHSDSDVSETLEAAASVMRDDRDFVLRSVES